MFNELAMRILRQRLGLEEDDTSKDELIKTYSQREALAELCGWEFGDSRWSQVFEKWCGWVGLEIVEKKK